MQLGSIQDVLFSLSRSGLHNARTLYAQLGEHKKVVTLGVVLITTICLAQRIRRPKRRQIKDRRYPLKEEVRPPSSPLMKSQSPTSSDPGPPLEENFEDEVQLGEDAAFGIIESPEASNRIDNNRVFHDLLQLYGRDAGTPRHRKGLTRQARRNPESLSDTETLEIEKNRPPPPPAELKDGRVIPGPAQGFSSADRRYNRQPSTRRRRIRRAAEDSGEEAEQSEPLSDPDEVSDSFSYTSTLSAPVFSQRQRREPRRRRPDLLAIPDLPPLISNPHTGNSLQALAKTLASSSVSSCGRACPPSSSGSGGLSSSIGSADNNLENKQ